MKRLSGWDAVLLYSEAPNVHMHTLKIAIIDLQDVGDRSFGVEEFRQVIGGRLYKLDPFRYELVDIPFEFHHPMWRENCEVDLDYHIRPWRVRRAGRPPRTRRGDRPDRQHSAGPQPSAVGDVLRRGPGQRPDRGGRQDPPRAGRRCRLRQPDGARHGSAARAPVDDESTDRSGTDQVASWCAPHSATTSARSARCPATIKYTAQGVNRVRRSSRKLSPELTRPFTPPPTFINHMLTPERRFATAHLGAGRYQGDQQAPRRVDQRSGAGHLGRCAAHAVAALRRHRPIIRCWRRCR